MTRPLGWCARSVHLRDAEGWCVECGNDLPDLEARRDELAAAEPPPATVVMTEGPRGTAWQRFASDGRWHGAHGKTTSWERLLLSHRAAAPVLVVYLPPFG